jgi:hypothetical protein
MRKDNIPTYDIYLTAYLSLNGIVPQFTKQGSRVVFKFPANAETYELMKTYNQNPTISILEYVSALRKTRAQMLSNR